MALNNGIKQVLGALGLDKKASLLILLVVKLYALIMHRNDILPSHHTEIKYHELPKQLQALYIKEAHTNFWINFAIEWGLILAIGYVLFRLVWHAIRHAMSNTG